MTDSAGGRVPVPATAAQAHTEEEKPERPVLELEPGDLRRRIDPKTLPFTTTAEVEPLVGTIGQPRAVDALDFGLGIETRGYNLFVAGAPGSGRTSTILDYLKRHAASRPVPDDWVYVYNFATPDRPTAIRLPAGRAREFARDLEELLQDARREIPRAFESEDYERRRRELMHEINARREAVTEDLKRQAGESGFGLEVTPVGMAAFPLTEGRPLPPEEFEQLPPETRAEIERRGKEVQEHVATTMRRLRQLEKEAAEATRQLDREVAQFALGALFHELRDRYADQPAVLEFLDHVAADIPNHLPDFRLGEGEAELPAPLTQLRETESAGHLNRYRVNVAVDNSAVRGAPVVVEANPTYYNLVGRIDYRAAFGTMVTDFHQIKAGALHRANGGYLVLQAADVLRNPFAWDVLKRSLMNGRVEIENLAEHVSILPTATLRPEPIQLEIKVILVGSPILHGLLFRLDQDFRELFKVKVDFAPDMVWNDEHVANYAAFISRVVRDGELRHFDCSAVGRVVEHGARLRESQRKLSTRLLDISDLVAEASFWATEAGHDLVEGADVDRAVSSKQKRSNLAAERIRELIEERTLVIETTGARVGQVNGIALTDLGDYVFGRPARVTARVSLSRGGVQSIEREIELSGPIHSKGVLTLAGYLAAQYAQECPLAFGATISFEQSYDEVEGDSASLTELCALLSELAELPLRQGIAVTGSINQHGDVQAVGGVTHKIEGFFEICRSARLTGDQGVVIPRANVSSLMLRDDVVEAVRADDFHVWAVESVDEGIEILTGRPAGERSPDSSYPEGSVHALVQKRVLGFAKRLSTFAAQGMAGQTGLDLRS